MPFNNFNKYEGRVQTLPTAAAHKECKKYARQKSVDITSMVISGVSAPFTGPFAYAVAAHSGLSYYKHSKKHEIVSHELLKRGEEVQPRKRDKVPGITMGLIDGGTLALKGVAKAMGLL